MKIECEECGWLGDPEDLIVEKQADHLVWTVYICPDCKLEIGRDAEDTNTWSRRLI